ncbi:hypothetical protein XF_0870 [Xylella fastidiosa 9a5c]|uniref:Uncharacterized protein n=1 Tax=Xylella fastidiosa (strain 9a5c) TaxID=160492 RepID=Q9PF08_XYLFA|nr:hypothetical protein XF_0870 [Xylella fastidiosa 9a5c]
MLFLFFDFCGVYMFVFYSVLERGVDFVGWLVRRWCHRNDVDFPVIVDKCAVGLHSVFV